MNKTIPLFVCFLLHNCLLFSQGFNWEWAQRTTGSSEQEGYGVAGDNFGNSFIVGSFYGNVITFQNTTLINGGNPNNSGSGGNNAFIAKYSPDGKLLWARCPDISLNAMVTGWRAATDRNGNVYFIGGFSGDSVVFGNVNLGYPTSRTPNFFLVKYDALGNVLWAKSAGDSLTTIYTEDLATDNDGNPYVTGYFSGSSLTFGTAPAINDTSSGMFLVKYDSVGNVTWAKDVGGQGIAIDESNNVYVVGSFGDSFSFDNTTLYNVTDSANSPFFVNYNSAGNLLWAKALPGNIDLSSIAVDRLGKIYSTGFFEDDSITVGPYNLQGNGDLIATALVVKLDNSGNVLWAKSGYGNNGNSEGFQIAVDTNSYAYVCGGFNGGHAITFGSEIIPYPTGFSADPMFIITLDSNGNIICSDAFVSGGDDNNAICIDKSGNVYAGGDFTGENPFILGKDTFQGENRGGEYVFLGKLNCGYIPTGIADINENYEMKLYPNPCMDYVNIKYKLPLAAVSGNLLVYDLLGREKANYTISGSEGQVTLQSENLNSGVYYCSMVVDGNNVAIKKVVVEH